MQRTQRDGVAMRLGGLAGQGIEELAQQAAAVGVGTFKPVVHRERHVLESTVAGDPAELEEGRSTHNTTHGHQRHVFECTPHTEPSCRLDSKVHRRQWP